MSVATLQTYIDAKQKVEALTYGLRALRAGSNACGGWETYRRQVDAAIEILGRGSVYDPGTFLVPLMQDALKQAREELKAAKADRPGRKQERLAIAAEAVAA